MRNIVNILGVNFDNVTMEEAVNIGIGLLDKETKSSIYTPNPEIVMEAYKNPELKANLNQGSLVIPDGIGVVIGSKIIKNPLKERVAGYDFTRNLFDYLKDTDKTVYFFGSKPGVADLAAKCIQKEFEGIHIVGICDGYQKDMDLVVRGINEAKPDLLLVGLGAPRQEAWISQYMNQIDATVFIGVGGSFDGFSGTVKRAPQVFIKLNLEWFYRLVTQPSRIFRMLQLPRFIIKMMLEGNKYESSHNR